MGTQAFWTKKSAQGPRMPFLLALAPWVPLALFGLASCATSKPIEPELGLAEEAGFRFDTAEWETIGESRDGAPIRALTLVGSGPKAGTPQRVALIAGIHGNEREGGRHLRELLETLSDSGLESSLRVYEDVNPDGTRRGVRGTTKGVDPNRNWPAKNFTPSPTNGPSPLSEPGVAAVHRDLLRWKPDLVIVLHSIRRGGPFVNYDGPGAGYAEHFAEGAGSDWPVVPSMGYPTPGSLGTWMGVDRGTPILTVEFANGCAADESWPALGHGVLAALATGGSEEIMRVR